MITAWKLTNFKSIKEMPELAIAPLTILTGTNSSGKSSLLQSILLIAQTMAYKDESKAMVLNGNLVHLGTFDSVKTKGSDGEIGIKFTVCKNIFDDHPVDLSLLGDGFESIYWRNEDKLSFDMNFDLDKNQQSGINSTFFPFLSSLLIENTKGKILSIVKQNSSSIEDIGDGHGRKFVSKANDYNLQNGYSLNLMEEAFDDIKRDYSSAKELGCEMSHFIPLEYYYDIDEIKEYSKMITNFLKDPSERYKWSEKYRWGEHTPQQHFQKFCGLCSDHYNEYNDLINGDGSPPFCKDNIFTGDIIKIIQKIYEKNNLTSPFIKLQKVRLTTDELCEYATSLNFEAFSLSDYLKWFNNKEKTEKNCICEAFRNTSDLENQVYQAALQTQNSFVNSLCKDKSNIEKQWNDPYGQIYPYAHSVLKSPFMYMRRSLQEVEKYWNNHIRYLGPLRERPKAIYPFILTADSYDVGLSGENTAMVLYLHKDEKQKSFRPSENENDFFKDVDATLIEHVNYWLDYLGIGIIEDLELIKNAGIYLTIQPAGSVLPQPLTALGAGASQLLPIIVMCLVSEIDTTLVFEQPEEQLHPKVQSLLADFFLAMSRVGKQCIVETHSGYLIDKLRYWKVADNNKTDTSFMREVFKIYFAEKDKEGHTSFNEIEVNEYGVMSEWPNNFFDESEEVAEKIIRASAIKRRKRESEDD